MRWFLFIPNILILLSQGLEQCCWCGAAGVKDASHLVFVVEGDDAELKQGLVPESDLSECAPPAIPGWHGVSPLEAADLVAQLNGAANLRIHPGIRRHRLLCQERC